MGMLGGVRVAALAAALLAFAAPAVRAADDAHATADLRRALTLLNVVAEEYREGVVDGQVVLPVEYEEARAFLAEAESRVRSAAPETGAATAPAFAALRTALAERQPLDGVRAGLDALRSDIADRTGVVEEIYPPAPPSAARGRQLFAENCSPCHGAQADGRGPQSAKLTPPPANFTDPEFMARETPFSFFNIVTAGKGRGMPAWGDVFSLQERWDLVSYLYTVQPGPAHLAQGQGIYLADCAGCHGASGDGRGEHRTELLTPPPPLNAPAALARQTDEQMVAAIAHGVPDSAMPAYRDRLDDAEIRAVASYVRLLSLGGPEGVAAAAADQQAGRRFAGLLRLLGDEYRKAASSAAPAEEPGFTASAVLAEQVRAQAPHVAEALAAADPTLAAALPQQVERIAAAVHARRPAAEVAALIAPLARSLEAQFPADTAGAPAVADPLAEAQRLLEQALAAYRDGDPRAVYLVSDAYFLFDPLEKKLALGDAALASRAEGRFAELRGLMGTPGNERAAGALVAAIDADLDAARAALAPRPATYGVLFQSAFIILREGFEVVLVVGALLAYVRKARMPAMRPPILWGTVAGGLASFASAYVLGRVAAASGATAEVIEGATMLLAAAVLFFVSYWLISKAEAQRWQHYIQGKVKAALATGNALALAGAAFLAVYREGVETVLFYKALIDSSPGAFTAVVIGLACGALGLAVVYVLYMRLGSRLPLRQFFLVTGGLLYYLAVVFAGKGVAELQGSGWISTTPVPWVPRIEFLGLYPTIETLVAQGALLLCVVYAVFVTVRRARREHGAGAVSVEVASTGGAKL